MKDMFGNVVLLSPTHVENSICTCELEDGDGCVGECYDTCDCYCERYSTGD